MYLDNECCANSISVVDLLGMNLSEHMRPGDFEDPAELPPVDERSSRLRVLPLEPDRFFCCLSELLAAPPPPPNSAACRRVSERDRFRPLVLNCFPEMLRVLPPPAARPTGRLMEGFCTLMEESRRRADWISASRVNWDMAETDHGGFADEKEF